MGLTDDYRSSRQRFPHCSKRDKSFELFIQIESGESSVYTSSRGSGEYKDGLVRVLRRRTLAAEQASASVKPITSTALDVSFASSNLAQGNAEGKIQASKLKAGHQYRNGIYDETTRKHKTGFHGGCLLYCTMWYLSGGRRSIHYLIPQLGAGSSSVDATVMH